MKHFRIASLPTLPLCAVLHLAALPGAACASPSGIDPAGMNRAAAPGDDFYAYANGAWQAATAIPADRSSWSMFAQIAEDTNPRLKALLEAAAADPAHAAPHARLAGDFYAAYLDEAAIEARGLAPLQPELRAIAALADKTALARYLGSTVRADTDVLNNTQLYTANVFGLWVGQGFDDPQHYHPYLMQGGLGMPSRNYYLTDTPRMADIRAKYQQHIATVLRLAGFAEPETRAARVFALERKLAEAHATPAETFDVLKANNQWRREEFAAKAPGLDWTEFFKGAGLERPPVFIVWHPRATAAVAALAAGEPLETWRDYLAFHAANRRAAVLPKAFGEAWFAFYGKTLSGTPDLEARWKRALAATNTALGGAVGRMFAEKYFPSEQKARVQTMVTNIVQAFSRRIDRLEWMKPATKAEAQAKLRVLYVGIGFPDQWTDYSGLVIGRGDAYGNVARAAEFRYRARVALLGGPVDPKEWCMTPQEVNAVNMPMQNALDFPAAILQPPFYDPAASDAYNYGAIGAVIGHEVSHSFDDQGSQFDSQGRVRDWWTPEDLAHFKATGAALVAQMSSYKPFPDLALNGAQTLSEDIADLAGVAAAYDAYRASRPAGAVTPPGEFTDDQVFFLAYAQSRRNKAREEALRRQILTDGHSPGQYRALTVRNLDAWYDAFGVKPGQTLHLAPADRVRVW